jgi:undecaprenyl-diphosphatase
VSVLEAISLGFIQGLTEFLPVSSSGHLVIAQNFMGLGGSENLTFDILLHVATLAAVLFYFRRDLIALVLGLFLDAKQRRLFSLLMLAMVPTGAIGLAIKSVIEDAFSSPTVVGFMLLITGTILFVAPRLARPNLTLDGIRLRQALVIGAAQGVAALPGISRSGTTLCVGMLSGVQSASAARFSFLLAIPAILAATALDARNITNLDAGSLQATAAGMATAFVVGLFSIHWLMRVARKGRFDGFAVYCWIVGIATIIVSATYGY